MTQTRDTAVLERLLEPVACCLTPEAARRLVDLHADGQFQERLDFLADRSTEGELTLEERDEYDTYVRAIHLIAILRVGRVGASISSATATGSTD